MGELSVLVCGEQDGISQCMKSMVTLTQLTFRKRLVN